MDNITNPYLSDDDLFFHIDSSARKTLEELPIPLIIYCPKKPINKLVLVSKGFCSTLGFTMESFWYHYLSHPRFMVHTNDIPKMGMIETFAMINSDKNTSGVIRLRTASGNYKWIYGTGHPKQDDRGNTAFYIICSDVSECWDYNQATNQATRHLGSLVQNILDTTSSAIFWKDIEGHFMGANKPFSDFVNIPLERLIGKTNEEVGLKGNGYPAFIDDRLILADQTIKHVSGQLLHSDGTPHDVIMSKTPLKSGEQIVGVVTSFEDVTNESHHLATINQLRNTINNIPVGLCVYKMLEDGTTKLIMINSTLRTLLNINDDDLAPQAGGYAYDIIVGLIHPSDYWQVPYSISQINSGIPKITCTYRIKPKDSNSYIWCSLSASYMDNGSNNQFIYVSFTDITSEKNAEQALAESRHAYQAAADGAGLVVWTYDISNQTMHFMDNDISAKVQKKFLLPKTLMNAPNSFEKHIDDSCLKEFRQMHQDILNGKGSSCDVLFKRFPGQPPHWERLIYSVSCNEQGKPVLAYGIGINITQQKLRDMQYHKELGSLHNVSQTNLISKAHIDLTDNTVLNYVSISPHSLSIRSGQSYSTFRNTLLELLTDSAEQQQLSKLLNHDNLIHQFVAGERSFSIEYHRNSEDLSPIMVETTLFTFVGKTNHIECFIYSYDITSKFLGYIIADKLAELGFNQMALVNNLTGTMTMYSRYTGVVESTPDKPLYYDQQLEQQLNSKMSPEESAAIMRNISLDTILEHLETETMYDTAFDIRDSEGKMHRNRLQCFFLDKTKTSIFIAQSDITLQHQVERKRLQELQTAIMKAEEANESKSMFLSSISHDMRTPLNGILSFTNFALNETDQQAQINYLHKIKQSGELLLNLINDTLNLTRIESGKVVLNLDTVDMPEMIHEISDSIAIVAEKRGVQLELLSDSENLPQHITIDKLKFQEICLNLISNAIKFTMPGGKIKFQVQSLPKSMLTIAEQRSNKDPDTLWAKLVIEDNGIGMSEAFLPKLFEPFTQEESQKVDNPTGTGLGLSIVKRYVDLMGGTIKVTSQLGAGTRFELHMPFKEAVHKEQTELTTADTFDYSQLHILVAEDNPINQEITAMLLSNMNISMKIVNNGKEAVDEFTTAPDGTYDLILMDIRMPVMNGYDATSAIRTSDKADAHTIPVIAMTADAYDEDVQKSIKYGMNGHVVKPVSPDKLYREIAAHCR